MQCVGGLEHFRALCQGLSPITALTTRKKTYEAGPADTSTACLVPTANQLSASSCRFSNSPGSIQLWSESMTA